MGDFIIITLMVSSFWLLWEIIRVVSMEWLNRDEITLPAGELGRSELLRCAAAVRPQRSAGTMEVKRGSADSTGSQRALSRGKS